MNTSRCETCLREMRLVKAYELRQHGKRVLKVREACYHCQTQQTTRIVWHHGYEKRVHSKVVTNLATHVA